MESKERSFCRDGTQSCLITVIQSSQTIPIEKPIVMSVQLHSSSSLPTERVGCKLCGANQPQVIHREQYELGQSTTPLNINRCGRCKLVYVSPRLTEEAIAAVYSDDSQDTISHGYCWSGSASEHRFAPLLKRLARDAQPGALLDVGCGAGHFLRAAKRTGLWQVMGIDPVPDAAREAAQYAQCEVRCATLENAGLESESFDVVAMLGVLEHLHDPVATLRLANSFLKPGGLLAVYVPNFNYLRIKDTGPLAYVRTGRWSKLHPQEHLFQYTPRTIRKILRAGGFETTHVSVGRPFAVGSATSRITKRCAYLATNALHAVTGIHLGGIELVARATTSISTGSEPEELLSGVA